MIRRAFAGLPAPRMTKPGVLAGLLVALAWIPATADARCRIAIDAPEANALAAKVWRNESGGDLDKILWWNRGEDFASLGIGHFIWYPPGVDGPFQESFPALVAFLSGRGVPMPAWLTEDTAPDSPWATREEFLDQRNGLKATQLRRLLIDSVALQAEFMVARLEAALDAMVATLPASRAAVVESRFCALAAPPAGRYALVDYVNFKGEGIKPEERYAGQGWGLKQVLEEMRGQPPANVDFADAAARVLERRVRNAPPERREQRWLPGWMRRVDSYRGD
ncbi:MAG: hypothetical protein BMS9Abin01_1162 [Gammaproteobacteria bacterium]|nr:MAG: hypothetical protein BMS9Abin01_1162 [Gammaproteobacteria bacterium]